MIRTGAKVFRVFLLIGFTSASAMPGLTESLWVPTFNGYITGIPSYEIGDIIRVLIDAESSLKYKSSRIDSENIVLEFSGGQTEGLFSFLPKAKASGTVDLKGEEDVSIGTSLAARIVGRDETGALQIQGRHAITLSGAQQILEIDGWVIPSSIDRGKSVSISHLADMRLTYTALVDDVANTISEGDVEKITSVIDSLPQDPELTGLPSDQETGDDVPATDEIAPEGTDDLAQPAAAPEERTTFALTEEKAEELLLMFINRFLDWVF